ncbi:MAG: DUF4139 domain-containing protein [Labilithrix sp.]|nr:DUF4139 domain-containing protein [Labilithrix sp.]
MRTYLLGAAALALVGCGQTTTSYVKSETTLGRVVVYRNGVAYFERYAEVQGDSLKLDVPHDKVDDFLKSLTVVDATTGEPAPISYPSAPAAGGTIDMKVGVTRGAAAKGSGGARPHKLRLSYVTEAPSWKPSYRVVVGKSGKVDLQGWAIVDNTSGEDWKDVRLGVGASSAMSFRFDLKGLRLVERETLQDTDLFAQAPPMGGASYGQPSGPARAHRVVGDLSDEALALAESGDAKKRSLHADATGTADLGRGGGAAGASVAANVEEHAAAATLTRMASALRANTQNQIVIEGYATAGDKDKMGASLQRANRLRDQLVRNGVDAGRIVALGKGQQAGRSGGARVVEAALGDAPAKTDDAGERSGTTPAATADVKRPAGEPIGTSHFESTAPMTVPKGTSAMVSILRSETEGEVVYLFDPESPRGNAQYPFRTLRFRNPTDSALESGPVSVFGDGRFVGEGLAEPIPARSVAFVPFALDRQIVVERKDGERDDIARILTVNRGVFSTELRHTKKASFTLFNRMGERATVYIKHTVSPGFKLSKFPDTRSPVPGAGDSSDHLAGANLFRVDLEPNGRADVEIEEATPVFRTTDIRTPAGLDLVRAYLSRAALDGPLKAQVEKLLELYGEMAKIEQRIGTAREQMGEYRTRMDELHAQLVTLKAVKTAGPLMSHLEKKLQEVSEKMSKGTVDLVTLQESLMVARVAFQAGVADLTLERPDAKDAHATN